MKRYDKLVRDRIPQLIVEDGRSPLTRFLNEWEYVAELKKKLIEEAMEYQKSGSIEELVDIGEVIHAILAIKNIAVEDYQKMRLDKREARGGFEDRIFLEGVEED
jgi:predicted house-cleaning noncanonical NTP pyrophosphatase (MazG superfamily)